MGKSVTVLLGIIIAILFLGLRTYDLRSRMNFSMDQGKFLMRSKEIWDRKELTLLGPTASPVVEGRQFFQGPVIYYALAIMGKMVNWDPLLISLEMVELSFVGMMALWTALLKTSGKTAAIYGGILMSVLPIMVKFSNFIWNPNFLMLVTPLFLLALVTERWLITGILAGIGLQFHFQFGLIILGSLIWLVVKKRERVVVFGVGSILGYLPLIVFDLRNNFYNSRTFWLWLISGDSGGVGWQTHYFISLAIATVYLLSIYLAKKKTAIGVATILLISLVAFYRIDWEKSDYQNLLKTEKLIKEDSPTNFNVVNLLTGDTRYYAMRYLLMKDGMTLDEVDKYPESRIIYVISDKMPGEFLKYPVWETSDLKIKEMVDKKEINNLVSLYKFEKK